MAAPSSTAKSVSTPSDDIEAQRVDWRMVTALLGGTKAMRAASTAYLPKWPNESDPKYTRRLSISTLFPAFKRTVVTLASRPFSKPVTIDDKTPPEIQKMLSEDVDLQGRSIDQFGADAMQVAVGYGFGGILVDHKVAPKKEGTAQPVTVAEEKAAGMRPYMVLIQPEQILGFKVEVTNGNYRLLQLRIHEVVDIEDGEFHTRKVEQVRVLEPGRFRIFRNSNISAGAAIGEGKVAASGVVSGWELFDEGFTTMTEIPFVPFYGERLGFMCGKPPLLELAHLNIKHWQSQSDQDNLLHVARVPLLTAVGIEDTPDKPFNLTVGTSGAIKLPSGAELKYVEHTGSAIEAGKTSLDDLKDEMRQSGAELLVMKPGPTTATEIASDNAVGMCDLQRVTLMLQDAMNQAVHFMLLWGGTIKSTDVVDSSFLTLFIDFGAATLAEASMQIVASMQTSGVISKRRVIMEGKRRGILSAEVDYEEELSWIEDEGPPLGKTDPLTGLPYKEPVPLKDPNLPPPTNKQPAKEPA